MDKEPITKALDAIFETMNVSRSHLIPNVPLRVAFKEDFKSLKSEYQSVLNRLLPKPKGNSNAVEMPTCFYSGFMRWLSKFVGGLHLELNSEDLDRCKLSRSDIGRLGGLDESTGSLGRSDSTLTMSDGAESSTCLDKLEMIDPGFYDMEEAHEKLGDPVVDEIDEENEIYIDGVGNNDDDDDEPPSKRLRFD